MQKEKMVIVIDSLNCGGAEKSLVNLLSLIDYTRYEVDLLLFRKGGMFETLVHKEVNLLPMLPFSIYCKNPLLSFSSLRNLRYSYIRGKFFVNRVFKENKIHGSQIYWYSCHDAFNNLEKKYDIAIAYGQGIPTGFVAEKVYAKRKYAWVNANYAYVKYKSILDLENYDVFNKIVCVSDDLMNVMGQVFPQYKDKMCVIYDINNYALIKEMAETPDYNEDGYHGNRILTIGSLKKVKGYDIAIEACKLLRERGVDFKWQVIGEGPERQQLEELISENQLQKHFILLGAKPNPYPYIKQADLYVQTSRSEGYGLAIAEARMLNIPVVTTEFDAVYSQMIHEKNGLVVKINPQSVADGIEKILRDNQFREAIIDYLKLEKKGNIEEIDKFYALIRS